MHTFKSAVFFFVVLVTSSAVAQSAGVTSSVALPAYSMSAPEDAFAVDINPAALSFLPAWSVTYQHADAESNRHLQNRGDAFAFAIPLFSGVAVGASAHSIRPTDATGLANRGLGSVALSFAPSERMSMGGALRFLTSADDTIDGITTVDLATTWRPSVWFATSLQGRDLTSPRYNIINQEVPRSLWMSLAIRPVGTNLVTLDGAGALDSDGGRTARGAVIFQLPWVGQLSAAYQHHRPDSGPNDWLVTAGLTLDAGRLSAGGGMLFAKGDDGDPGYYITARLDGAHREGLPHPGFWLEVEIEGDNARQWLNLLWTLEQAFYDQDIKGLVIRPRAGSLDLAHAQELRMVVEAFQKAQKPVFCHFEDTTGSEYYACAGAQRVAIDEAGGIRLMGPHMTAILFGDLLEKIGLRADFMRIGDYKSAAEQFTRHELTATARADKERFITHVNQRLITDFAKDWKRSPKEAQALVDQGPFAAAEALEAGLVSQYGDESELDDALQAWSKQDWQRREELPTRAPLRWGKPARVGVVMIDGTLVDGDNVDVPFLGIHMTGSRTIVEAIEGLMEDPSVRVVLVRIDSPGGSALASDRIWRALMKARKKKPIVASIGSIAASGGYYIASAADEIWAPPSALTGSIGIYFGKVDASQLAKKLGVGIEHFARGKHAGAESMWRPFTDEERALLGQKIGVLYELFLERVAKGRNLSVDYVRSFGEGRIYTADAAQKIKLIDRLGGFNSALKRARLIAGLHSDAALSIVPEQPQGLLEYMMSFQSSTRQEQALLSWNPKLRSALGALVTLSSGSSATPLALLPYWIEVP